MAQRGVKDFFRAANEHDLGRLGDPERWGDIQTLEITLGASDVSRVADKWSKQLVRAQAPGLEARQWLVFANYELIDPSSTVGISTITAEIMAGVGQASLKLNARVAPQSPLVPTPFTSANTAIRGSLELGAIPASAIAIRFHCAVAAPSGNAVTIKLRVGASVAPRAL